MAKRQVTQSKGLGPEPSQPSVPKTSAPASPTPAAASSAPVREYATPAQDHPTHVHDHATHPAAAHDESHTHHLVSISTYLKVFVALMVLLVLTLVAAIPDLGMWSLPIAMTIAVIKAVLVVLFFMHVAYSSNLVKFFAGAALFWLVIMFVMTLSDYVSRSTPF